MKTGRESRRLNSGENSIKLRSLRRTRINCRSASTKRRLPFSFVCENCFTVVKTSTNAKRSMWQYPPCVCYAVRLRTPTNVRGGNVLVPTPRTLLEAKL